LLQPEVDLGQSRTGTATPPVGTSGVADVDQV
jgi:hypothetical protein